MSDLREKIASALYDECFVPAKEPYGDANAALYCAEKADEIISLCQPQWISMESAPKDGTVILAWRFYPVAMRWTKDKHYPWEAVQLGAKITPFLANGFHADDPALKGWQPLPEPPEESK